MTEKILNYNAHFHCLFWGIISFFIGSVCVIWGPWESLMTSVQHLMFCHWFWGVTVRCAVSFVDNPSEHVPLLVGWVSLVTHLGEHAVPSLFPLNNVNGPVPRHIREAAGGTANTKALPNKKTERVTRANAHTKCTIHCFPLQREKMWTLCMCLHLNVQAWDAHVSACMPECLFVYVVLMSLFCVCTSMQLSNSSEPPPWPPRQHKEQESIELNGQPSASWLELNGNVKLAMDPFCLSVEGPVSPGSPNRIIPSQWQSTPQCFHFMSSLSV